MTANSKGLSWSQDVHRIRVTSLVAVVALILSLFAAGLVRAPAIAGDALSVIVRETNPASDAAESLVERLGGAVGDHISLIGGFTAIIPGAALGLLDASPAITDATPDATVDLTFEQWGDGAADLSGLSPKDYGGSLYRIVEETGARDVWNAGYTGAGIDVALIDSGVAPVAGLNGSNKIVNGPDLSFESQSDAFRYLDTFGHGTHMAGIIAGRDQGASQPYSAATGDYFVGMAPDSRIVSVKVAGHDGATDVSQVIAAIDWVVQHKNDNGLNIRVLNLSFGTDSTQSYVFDPLAYAVEQAWKRGIVVVVATGNDGNSSPLRNPAIDPFVIAVGSHQGNKVNAAKAETVSDFSNCGTSSRSVDLLARGRSVLSLRSPGSSADEANPEARVIDRLFLGTGTSQAAAVVSGASALMLSARPSLTPDQLKALFIGTGLTVKQAKGKCSAPSVNVKKALAAPTPIVTASYVPSTGQGSLEAARGSDHLEMDGVVLSGEQDIFGKPWNGTTWSTAAALGTTWSGGTWNGTTWSGTTWSGTTWSGTTWSGTTWSGTTWSGTTWSNRYWTGTTWSGTTWSGTTWSGTTWSGTTWSRYRWD